MRTEKTGTELFVPVLPVLQAVIDATKTGDLAFIAQANGRPMTKESFGNWFRDACKAAGVPGAAQGGLNARRRERRDRARADGDIRLD